jgi:hypothetical protein
MAACMVAINSIILNKTAETMYAKNESVAGFSVKITEKVHQNPVLLIKSNESCDSNACVQCQRTK